MISRNLFRSAAVLLLLSVAPPLLHSEGFLRVSGKDIVDGSGRPFLLRGMGLGGWLLPEGYMFQMSSFANAPWEIKKKVIDVVGAEKADTFWTAFRKNFVRRVDMERLSQLGFNSVRMAMHWEFYMNADGSFRQEGFTITDSLLVWCAEHHVYLILDLHAAPGGQSANNISDYNSAYPSLWQSETNKQMTVNLWKKLAERYAKEPWIGGYDILNEPAWDLPPSNKPLRDLSVAITTAIRTVDTTHIVFVEGNWYATDFNGMEPAWDPQMVWSFHKYWNANDNGAINYLLTLRNNSNRPLWLGESGENSNTWFTDCITLLENNNIGWSWWTLKKFGTINGPFSVPASAGYNALLSFWKGQGAKPSVDNAMAALMGMANGLALDKCVFNAGVIDAMFRQVSSSVSKPFAEHSFPGTLFLTEYDMGKNGIAYKDNVYQNIGGTDWNNGWSFRNDGVDIEACADAVTNGYNIGWTETGEFLYYTVNVAQPGTYAITLRASCGTSGGYVGLAWDGGAQNLTPITLSGGWQSWKNYDLGTVDLAAGSHQLRLTNFFGGYNLNYLKLTAAPTSATDQKSIPAAFSLYQNFPNPFNPATTIRYDVPQNGPVRLEVFDLLGTRVRVLVNDQQSAGVHSVRFDAAGIASGLYYYRLTAGGRSLTKMMTVLK